MRRWFPRRPSAADSGAPPPEPPRILPDRAALDLVAGRPPLRPSTDRAPTATELIKWLSQWPDAPPDEATFHQWINEPASDGPTTLSKFVFAAWRSRADLRLAFPGVPVDLDAQQRFLLWAHLRLAEEAGAPDELIPQAPVGIVSLDPPTLDGQPVPPLGAGVVVFGFLRSVLGLGEAGRRLVWLCERAGEFTRSLSFDYSDAPLGVMWSHPAPSPSDALDVVVIAANGTEARTLREALGARATHGRYVIGLWFWELEELSPAMAAGFAAVDEVWVTSEFTASAVRRSAPAGFPVQVLPLGADLRPAPPRTPQTRARFGLPTTATVVGNVFDYASRIERKNPVGLIDAWKRAFPTPDRNARVLFFKTLNAASHLDSSAIVEAATDGRDDIIIRDERLSSADRDLLVPQFDAVASLHRAEGYGLTLLEAMHHGLPVIASDYSGNLAFMTPNNSWLVPCRPATVDDDSLVSYPKGGRWAEPDIDAAALTIRYVVENIDSSSIRERAQRGEENVRALIGGSAGAAWIADRLATIRRDRNRQR